MAVERVDDVKVTKLALMGKIFSLFKCLPFLLRTILIDGHADGQMDIFSTYICLTCEC